MAVAVAKVTAPHVASLRPKAPRPKSTLTLERKPDSFWKNSANEKRLLGEFLRFKFPSVGSDPHLHLELWYNLTSADLRNGGGATLLKKYKSSLVAALRSNYPTHPWQVWRFKRVPLGYWKSHQSHAEYFSYLRDQLGYSLLEDWYKLTRAQVIAHGGGALLANYYKDSPTLFVTTMLPDHKWLNWKFPNVPHSYWKEPEHRKAFIDWLTREIKQWNKLSQWYQLKGEDFHNNGGGGMLAIYYSDSVYRAYVHCIPRPILRPSFPLP